MTAPIVTRSLEPLAVDPWYGYRSLPIASRSQRAINKGAVGKKSVPGKPNRDRLDFATVSSSPELSHLWSRLLEVLPQGVIIVSRNLKPVYCNQKAQKLCQALAGERFAENVLPLAISEACYSVLRDSQMMPSSLMIECQTSTGHLIRVSAQILESATVNPETPYIHPALTDAQPTRVPTFIAVFLENCDEVLQQEAWIQQQKYDLTERETEIWMLLRQELTYQEIAQALQISLNTVKTHVKNVYAKRRSGQSKEKFWC